jgi:thiamine-phosphate pyrophosphorylase
VERPAVVMDVADAIASTDVAAVLLRLADADERSLINLVKEIAPAVQRRDVALILADRDDIVARSGADGAHLSNVEALKEAVSRLKPKSIAGAGGLYTRH